MVLPDERKTIMIDIVMSMSQCTYRCVVLPDEATKSPMSLTSPSQCTYRCVVLPDAERRPRWPKRNSSSQCTYRCVVLPDMIF